jgi:glycosidase
MMEFHISRKARERYQFAESLFSYSGNVVFANLAACREFAQRMNAVRDVERHPERVVHAGKLYAMGLIDEASHVLMARYREQFDPEVMTSALEWFSGKVGADAMGKLLLTFVEQFPGMKVMRGEQTPIEWLAAKTEGTSHWAVAMEELILLWTANRNEAFHPFQELFEEKSLAERTVYRKVTRRLPEYFATRPLIPLPDAKPMNLLELLRAPALGAPRSLSDQLALIRKLWKPLIGDSLERFLLIAGEVLREEELAIWKQFNPPDESARRRRESGRQRWPGVVSTAEVPEFGDPAHEYEKFSPDQAWMPTAVLMAKSTYVWMAQMSRQHGRWIKRLDEIPDEELATLAHRGINTLWLIGIWERSRASRTIKQLCGNSDAVASAYSIFDYAISEDLGGEAAYVNLRDRAYKYGIRLASDMVPNHMGIDSPWVVEHPDWFISRHEPPYPAYSFNGPDLSSDGRVEIKIEDHYYEQSDAAVVFQRRDRSSGETRYIYHGNDGTSFPWNDTAQLDYMNPAVREQVIQTILHVARLFPVIRFDAAMTLAKRHFHRLWFPGPGSSGAIPSRAEYGMSQADFNQAMPHEFWREVVDRVAAEVPGTLLLAEAFWLMEGYFVRTLGMHRVYNSAFMVMLRDEENAKYRSVIKKTLEFDPDIMKRYVNFMSNPDERTAIDQFGKGDKCFGVAAMMATLPGLPMFGHGQIEGFTEKYGMEYQRPRYEENADPWLVRRHEREIAPLLKRRRLFAESGNFLLYDFYTDAGKVDENVFAYSNRSGNERALVVFNNRYGETHGTIDYSTAYADKGANQLRQQRIGEGLGFGGHAGAVMAWRDSLTGLEYLRRASDLHRGGLTLDLRAYQCHVFVDWCELYSTQEKPWDRLSDQLNGRGVPSLEDALINLELQPVHDALRALLDPGMVRRFADLAEHPRTVAVGVNKEIEAERAAFFGEAWARCENLMRVSQKAYQARREGTDKEAEAPPANPGLLGAAFRSRLRAAMRIPAIEALFAAPWPAAARRVLPSPSPQLTATAIWGPVFAWCVLELLAESFDPERPEPIALDLFDRLRLREPFAKAFAALGYEGEEAWRVAARVKVLMLTGAGVGKPEATADDVALVAAEPAAPPVEHERLTPEIWPALWLDPDVRWLTGVHQAEGHEYLVRESYEELLWWLLMPRLLRLAGETAPDNVARNRAAVDKMNRGIVEALAAASAAGYRVEPVPELGAVEAVAEESAAETTPEVEAETETATEAATEAAVEAVAEVAHKPELVEEAEPAAVEVPEPVEPEIDARVESAIESVVEAPAEVEPEVLAEALTEPANEAEVPAIVEPEPVAEATFEAVADVAREAESTEEAAVAVAEPSEPVEPEPEIDAIAEPVIESAAEFPAEAQPETEPTNQVEPAPVEVSQLAELEIDVTLEAAPEAAVEVEAEPAPENVSEVKAEPERSHEAEDVPVEESKLSEPESQPTTASVIEVAAETTIETTDFESPVEAVPVPSAEVEPAEAEVAAESEPLIVAAAEPATEVIAEIEPEAASTEIAAPVEPKSEVVVEPVAESPTEAVVQADASEPELIVLVQPEPAEEPLSAKVQADSASQLVVEVLPEPVADAPIVVEAKPEPPSTDQNPVKSAIGRVFRWSDFIVTKVGGEPKPAAPEIETTPETAFKLSDSSFARAESGPAAEPAAEPVINPIEVAKSRPSLAKRWESMAPKIEPAARPVAEPDAVVKPLPQPANRWEPPAPKIDLPSRDLDEPGAAAEKVPSLTKRWEPPAPRIDLVAKSPAEVRADKDAPPPATEPWEKPAQKDGSEADALAEPRSLAELLLSLNQRWEPPAPKIEFVAKPASQVKAEAQEPVSHDELSVPKKPQSDLPE